MLACKVCWYCQLYLTLTSGRSCWLWFVRCGSFSLSKNLENLVKSTLKRCKQWNVKKWKYYLVSGPESIACFTQACAFEDFQPTPHYLWKLTYTVELGYNTLNVGGATRQVLSIGPGLMGKRRIGLGECEGLGVRLQHIQHNSSKFTSRTDYYNV